MSRSLGCEHLPPGKREKLAGHLSAAARGLADLAHVAPCPCAGELARAAHELGQTEDHRHHVVDLVGDAPGELPAGLQSLRLLHPDLRGPLLGHVGHHTHGASDAIILGGTGPRRHPHPLSRQLISVPSERRCRRPATRYGDSPVTPSAGTRSVRRPPSVARAVPTRLSNAAFQRSMQPGRIHRRRRRRRWPRRWRATRLRRHAPRARPCAPEAVPECWPAGPAARPDASGSRPRRCRGPGPGWSGSVKLAETWSTGEVPVVRGSARTRRTTSNPSMSGIRMSRHHQVGQLAGEPAPARSRPSVASETV